MAAHISVLGLIVSSYLYSIYSFIHNSTLVLNYSQMMMTYLSRPPQNMNSILGVCNSLRTNSMTSFVGNHWATG